MLENISQTPNTVGNQPLYAKPSRIHLHLCRWIDWKHVGKRYGVVVQALVPNKHSIKLNMIMIPFVVRKISPYIASSSNEVSIHNAHGFN